jgi:hypothetical protein
VSFDTGWGWNEPWQAKIIRERVGYSISYTAGLLDLSTDSFAWTARGAIRKSRRKLARLNAERHRRRWTITEPS